MLMAKCCHDVDWLSYIVGNKQFAALSSFGSLFNFRKVCSYLLRGYHCARRDHCLRQSESACPTAFAQDKKPAGAADRCIDCSLRDHCPYSATSLYLERVQAGHTSWPVHVLVDGEPTEAAVEEALRTGPYGRCAWSCDNDVMDNQVVNMQFTDGSTCTLTTTAFTKVWRGWCGAWGVPASKYVSVPSPSCARLQALCVRHTRVFGTLGELEGDGESVITQRNFITGETIVSVVVRGMLRVLFVQCAQHRTRVPTCSWWWRRRTKPSKPRKTPHSAATTEQTTF